MKTNWKTKLKQSLNSIPTFTDSSDLVSVNVGIENECDSKTTIEPINGYVDLDQLFGGFEKRRKTAAEPVLLEKLNSLIRGGVSFEVGAGHFTVSAGRNFSQEENDFFSRHYWEILCTLQQMRLQKNVFAAVPGALDVFAREVRDAENVFLAQRMDPQYSYFAAVSTVSRCYYTELLNRL